MEGVVCVRKKELDTKDLEVSGTAKWFGIV